LLTPEAVTLAQRLVNRQTTKTHLLNEGFSRYSLNSKEGLPNWFLDDEAKHYKANLPITKEAVRALREKQRALDARPIKKVAEAKARKKLRAAQRLEKAMKKAEGVNQTADMTEREKASQIEKLMRKGVSKGKKKNDIKVVVAKGPNKGIKGRPRGVKGRYKIVDARMRKEVGAGSYRTTCSLSSEVTDLDLISRSVQKNGEQRKQRSVAINDTWIRFQMPIFCLLDFRALLAVL
jgi:AdoMet-dependent rRNA methyltransferase SPB1